jgi:hypothetical protein
MTYRNPMIRALIIEKTLRTFLRFPIIMERNLLPLVVVVSSSSSFKYLNRITIWNMRRTYEVHLNAVNSVGGSIS